MDQMFSAAMDADPDVLSLTSYNEWGEGTQVRSGHLPLNFTGHRSGMRSELPIYTNACRATGKNALGGSLR
jgi:hypothetical protein